MNKELRHVICETFSLKFSSLLPLKTTGTDSKCYLFCLKDSTSTHTLNSYIQECMYFVFTVLLHTAFHYILNYYCVRTLICP